MAHEAVVSLNLIIESLLNIGYDYSHNPILRYAEFIHEELWSLKSILESDHFKETERLISLKGEILEAIPKFRDLLKDLLKDRINKRQSLDDGSSDEMEIFYQASGKFKKQVKKEMISFVETMKKIKDEFEVYQGARCSYNPTLPSHMMESSLLLYLDSKTLYT
ncbi:hypothetical protein ACJIZ3_009303 [Penstemon smallii]|uniref:Uncharacterized protein n=1 Tax=Penstemon smallii TaxID=265156 RepID=A0ABD3TCM9_9LAMI